MGAHAVGFAVLAQVLTAPEPHPDAPAPAPATAVVEPVESAAIEVSFLSEEAAAVPTTGVGGRRAITASTTTKEPAAAPDVRAGDGDGDGHANAFAMRGLRHDLRLSGTAAERIVSATTPTTERAEETRWAHDPKLKLEPSGGGTLTLRDPVTTLRVAPDGSVDMTKTLYFSARLNLPTPSTLQRELEHGAKDFTAWTADPYRDRRVSAPRDLPTHLRAVPGSCDRWGDPNCFTAADQAKEWAAQDEDHASKGGPIVDIKVDVTGYLMDKLVGDPYASRKLKILDQTRAERVELGTAYRKAQGARSAELVRRNLEALWRTTSDPAQRRAALFAIWDECTEDEAGERARAMVIGWIHARLPAGAADAFTPAELDAFDARRTSRAHFR
ncbi:MAG: hypothetical protein ABI867_38765, partial [Kofleriaceae bacterium]